MKIRFAFAALVAASVSTPVLAAQITYTLNGSSSFYGGAFSIVGKGLTENVTPQQPSPALINYLTDLSISYGGVVDDLGGPNAFFYVAADGTASLHSGNPATQLTIVFNSPSLAAFDAKSFFPLTAVSLVSFTGSSGQTFAASSLTFGSAVTNAPTAPLPEPATWVT